LRLRDGRHHGLEAARPDHHPRAVGRPEGTEEDRRRPCRAGGGPLMPAATTNEPAAASQARWDGDPILTVEHLPMRFGGLIAVNAVSLTVGRGAITASLGRNGAGRSTVFSCVTGFYKPTEGRIAMRHGAGTQADAVAALTATGHRSRANGN